MRRDIYFTLQEWMKRKSRRPVLLRGARQVGKTYVVQELGRNEFDNYVHVNFEKNPEYKDMFGTFSPKEILERISLLTGIEILPGKTLLFFDEIQECPKAITALRYFYEEMPSLHIIAAGSLLEFALRSESLLMPVGRIQYLFMYPMSFMEFLDALGQEKLRKYVTDTSNFPDIPEEIHEKLLELVRKYFILGGMPAVIQDYLDSGNIIQCQRIQRSITDTFLDDFAKYAKEVKHQYLTKVFNAVPSMIGDKFMYARVDKDIKSRELKEAHNLLEMAGIIRKVFNTSGAGLPMKAGMKDNFFKTIFLDVGLLHSITGVYSETVSAKDFTSIYNGIIAEQFVGQELIAYQDPYTRPELYYWAREAKSSNAEVDYLVTVNNRIIPVEVKSGHIGKMKSLQMFMNKFSSMSGIVISNSKYNVLKNIRSMPFYALKSLLYQ